MAWHSVAPTSTSLVSFCAGYLNESSGVIYGLGGASPCNASQLGYSPRLLYESIETDRKLQKPATLALEMCKLTNAVWRPSFAIIMAIHNAGRALRSSLPSLLSLTSGSGELLMMLDDCTDGSFEVIIDILGSHESGFAVAAAFGRARVLRQEIPRWEAASENTLMRLSNAAEFYICVQPDNIVAEVGWNLRLAAPLRAFTDVFSVSGLCAHSLDWPFLRLLRGRVESQNLSVQADQAGPCCCLQARLPTEKTYATALRGTGAGTPVDFRNSLFVRETANRGPLLLHAQRMRELGFFDAELFPMDNSDHDLMCRALVAHGWVASHYSIAIRAPWSLKTRGHETASSISRDLSRAEWVKREARRNALLHSRNDNERRVGCAEAHHNALRRLPPRQEVRFLAHSPVHDFLHAAHDGRPAEPSTIERRVAE